MTFSQKTVNLLDKFKSRVLFVENQSVNIVNLNLNFASIKEKLQLLPIITLLAIVLCILKAMHVDVAWKVTRKDFSNKKAVVERPAHVFDRVRKIKRLNPFEHFSR